MRPYMLRHPFGLAFVATFAAMDVVYHVALREPLRRSLGITVKQAASN